MMDLNSKFVSSANAPSTGLWDFSEKDFNIKTIQ